MLLGCFLAEQVIIICLAIMEEGNFPFLMRDEWEERKDEELLRLDEDVVARAVGEQGNEIRELAGADEFQLDCVIGKDPDEIYPMRLDADDEINEVWLQLRNFLNVPSRQNYCDAWFLVASGCAGNSDINYRHYAPVMIAYFCEHTADWPDEMKETKLSLLSFDAYDYGAINPRGIPEALLKPVKRLVCDLQVDQMDFF